MTSVGNDIIAAPAGAQGKTGKEHRMTERKIRLNNAEEAGRFVEAAEKCPFDVDLCRGNIVVDAKSLMGVLGMDLTSELTVRYHHEADEIFDRMLRQFEV